MVDRPDGRARITRGDFAALTEKARGLDISETWRGYGSAIFLEIGPMRLPTDPKRRPRGEFSVMIEWSWRVESARSIAFGSWSGERKITSGVEKLRGRTVAGLSVEGRLPELAVELEGGRRVRSFMTAEGQPEWAVFLPDGSWLTVERGGLIRERKPPARGVDIG